MFGGMAVLITAFYTVKEDSFATLRISGDNDNGLGLIVLHTSGDNAVQTTEYNFLGSQASPKLEVENRDLLAVIARRHGIVVASQVYEVDTTATERDYLLIPRGGFNILCDQEEQLRKSELEPQKVEVHACMKK